MTETVAILCADVHLSDKPPLARCGEPDWYAAMARPLEEVKDLQKGEKVPIIVAGDLFDRWNSPPRLINFAIRHLAGCDVRAVAGQHDLPHHSWDERFDSAFWTLVEADAISLLEGFVVLDGRLAVRGFRWGEELESNDRDWKDAVTLAVAHKYCWIPGCTHQGVAAVDNSVKVFAKWLRGFDAALFGDNHKGFVYKQDGRVFFNAGTFMRRASDERDYAPMVGLLKEDGSVEIHRLDTSRDVFCGSEKVQEAENAMIHLDRFVEELRKMGDGGLDFRFAVESAMQSEGVSRDVRRVILDAMEER